MVASLSALLAALPPSHLAEKLPWQGHNLPLRVALHNAVRLHQLLGPRRPAIEGVKRDEKNQHICSAEQ